MSRARLGRGSAGNEFRILIRQLERARVDRERAELATLHRKLGHAGRYKRCRPCREHIRHAQTQPAE